MNIKTEWCAPCTQYTTDISKIICVFLYVYRWVNRITIHKNHNNKLRLVIKKEKNTNLDVAGAQKKMETRERDIKAKMF